MEIFNIETEKLKEDRERKEMTKVGGKYKIVFFNFRVRTKTQKVLWFLKFSFFFILLIFELEFYLIF